MFGASLSAERATDFTKLGDKRGLEIIYDFLAAMQTRRSVFSMGTLRGKAEFFDVSVSFLRFFHTEQTRRAGQLSFLFPCRHFSQTWSRPAGRSRPALSSSLP